MAESSDCYRIVSGHSMTFQIEFPVYPLPTWEWPQPERNGSTGRLPVCWISRFLKLVEIADGCWLWKGLKDQDGYGGFDHYRAHRLMWIVIFGQIPITLQVLHHCDNPPCVNPFHLWLGTQSDNMKDMHSKGRAIRYKFPIQKGIHHWNYKHGKRISDYDLIRGSRAKNRTS